MNRQTVERLKVGLIFVTGLGLIVCMLVAKSAMWAPVGALLVICVLGEVGADMASRSRRRAVQDQKDDSNLRHEDTSNLRHDTILLVNNRGQAIQVPVDTTISELVNKYGVDSIAIQEPDAPLGDDWYQAMRTSEQKAGHV